ncbi:MAG: hypothetical protein KAT62_09820, partial [Desulfuromonadales bacterium]|nr:hypothetical protein [Desulfuromonadales bacterium]
LIPRHAQESLPFLERQADEHGYPLNSKPILQGKLFGVFREQVQISLAVFIIKKDCSTVVATLGDMMRIT